MSKENQSLKVVQDKLFDDIEQFVAVKKDISDRLYLSEEEKRLRPGKVQWTKFGDAFGAVGDTLPKIPSGWYNPTYSEARGFLMVPISINSSELINLPYPEYDAVLGDLQRFWKTEELYRKYKFAYKRGILLKGGQGTGKSGLVRLVCDTLIKKQDGIVYNVQTPNHLYAFMECFNDLRKIEPNRKVVCVFEDVDNLLSYEAGTFLNILDGNMEYDNIAFIATTNFPDRLLESVKNRPSRFDRIYEIGAPDENVRRVYITTKFPQISETDVDKLVRETSGFTIDMLKECILSIFILSYDMDETLQLMKNLFSHTRVQ